jgi:hypothetical protein
LCAGKLSANIKPFFYYRDGKLRLDCATFSLKIEIYFVSLAFQA